MAERIIRLDSVDSTNNYIRRFDRDGTIVLADTQTAGRGRQGRSFQSVPGCGIYLSLLLKKTELSTEQVFYLTPIAAQGVCDAVEAVTGRRPAIKWINDLLMDGRKICGILTELDLKPDGTIDRIILGIGINVNHTLEQFDPQLRDKAGSIAMATGRQWDGEELLKALVPALDRRIELWLRGEIDLAGYRRDCVTLGSQVRVIRGKEIKSAFAEAVTDDFGLVVRYPDGSRETLSSGEVSVRGANGYL